MKEIVRCAAIIFWVVYGFHQANGFYAADSIEGKLNIIFETSYACLVVGFFLMLHLDFSHRE